MKKVLPIIIVVLVVLGAGGIYLSMHKSTANTSSDMQGMSMPNQPASSGNPQATDKVTIANFAFSPANITVKKGTTVTWTNQDSIAHTVTESDSQNGPASSDLAKGKSYSFTYSTLGTFKYHCTIHPDMVGTVTVTQ